MERIALEKKWVELEVDNIPDEGLSTIPMGKEWYAYFLKKWVDKEVTPDQMFEFGLNEIERGKSSMKALQVKSGMDSLTFQNHINAAIDWASLYATSFNGKIPYQHSEFLNEDILRGIIIAPFKK